MKNMYADVERKISDKRMVIIHQLQTLPTELYTSQSCLWVGLTHGLGWTHGQLYTSYPINHEQAESIRIYIDSQLFSRYFIFKNLILII